MAKTEHYHTKFEEDRFYHIYNRVIDKKPLFLTPGNQEFFMKKFQDYIIPVADLFAYSLLGNHFHFLIRVKDLTTFKKLSNLKTELLAENDDAHMIVSQRFKKFFQSYAMAFNKQQNRFGTLFQTPFKRALVNNDDYLTHLIFYIHSNPQHHKLTDDFRTWKWSSYFDIIQEKNAHFICSELMDIFGDTKNFKSYHDIYHFDLIEKFSSIEDIE